MSTEELKEYLGIVVDMEESVFFQNRLCQNIDQEIERLKIPTEFPDPDEPIEPSALSPSLTFEPELYECPHSTVGIIAGCIGCFFAGGCGGFIFAAMIHNPYPVFLCLMAPIIWAIYCNWDNKTAISENKQKNAQKEKAFESRRKKHLEEMAQYQQRIARYQTALTENQLKRQQDKTERENKTIFLENQKKEVKKKLAISKERLQIIYQKNIIFPKYRNLAMACSLYEYICAGRCTELEGHEGAYNILEAEIRLDHIILQLDKVIAQLEQIGQNQFTLYSAVQECNQRLGLIMESIREMAVSLNDFYSSSIQNSIQLNAHIAELNAQNTQLNAHVAELQEASALTAYHAERTQKELAYMNRMDYLTGRNDDVFWNHPPV